MKNIFAVALLLVCFAGTIMADGSGQSPPKPIKPIAASYVQIADGSGLPPAKPHFIVPAAMADGSGLPPKPVKPTKTTVIHLADGSGLPPAQGTKPPEGNTAA
jgi:hypothetical protein